MSKRKWSVIIGVGAVIALFPIVITVFELIKTDKESVVFLEGYPTSIVVLILLYYALLMILGIFWFTKQVVSFFRLKSEISKAELQHLKSQVNPHFFFNTLNNLYGLVDKDPKKAQDLILKLSDLMRYSIYEGEKDLVELNDEVDYLKNYVGLHKMRYHKDVDVEFNTDIEKNCKVMPLLFIILVENAFKHGVEKLRERSFVHINIVTFENKIQFDIENNFDDSESVEDSGIGLKNLKRRLGLVYPNKHKLSFSVRDNVYKATLILDQL
ncbi:sensor histidine kinase [Lutimonas zeaxanthinifaciens]|uniref:sensor histidine kinase n=1 Tax=Lutimonas zeaxanthinifaciens TaxID=3060215 RepID=UPI00265CD82C|nr:histidine kinase [Lutimonas sp. YSD2104]WKK67071.1 histidine kinase [Lutimonas sp. YSD2104]